MTEHPLLCVGHFLGAHGVRGLARLRSETEDPTALFTYAPLLHKDGTRLFSLTLKSADKDTFIVAVEGITDREAAQALRGEGLYISRALLPPRQDHEYYHADLIGLLVRDAEGKEYGHILALHDHGAGTFLEIGTTRKDSFMLPFTNAFVPTIDLHIGAATIILPEGWL